MAITDIKQQFFDSLVLGTGRAYFILNQNPHIDFSALILKGATRNYAYDKQCEGTRADYIFRLIQTSRQKDGIVKSVLRKLQSEKNDCYGLDQMFDLAVMFYNAGYAAAKQSVYNRFEKNRLEGYAFGGTDAMLELWGVEGVFKVAELIGEILLEDPDDCESSWKVDQFQKHNKQVDIYKELENAAMNNRFIKAYYDSILENKWTSTKREGKVTNLTYEIVKERIETQKIRLLTSDRNIELTEPEVERLANEFLVEKDKQRREFYLRFFSSRKFPLDYHPILKLAFGRNPKGIRLVYFAIKSLSYFQSEELRAFAIGEIINRKDPSDYLCLLNSNYVEGDFKLLTEVISRSSNYDYIHSVACAIIEIYKSNPTKECQEPLELIYNKMNCGMHRSDIVMLLNKNDVLSVKILKELEFDSCERIRELFIKKNEGVTESK